MRISRRTSHTGAATAAGSARTGMAVGAVAAALALALAGCSNSTSTPALSPTSRVSIKPADDIQILNALELTTGQLNAAFGVDGATKSWQNWTPSDKQRAKIGLTAFLDCKGDIKQDGVTEKPIESFFSFEDGTSATTAPTSASGKRPPTTPSTSADPGSAVPDEWVGSVALIYKDTATATSAARRMGSFDKTNAACGAPTAAGKPGVLYLGGSVETNPSWYGANSVFVFVDTKEGATMTALAQQRGRFVIVTYTKGSSKPEAGYYTLNSTKDAVNAAAAATTLLSQLTDAVVAGG